MKIAQVLTRQHRRHRPARGQHRPPDAWPRGHEVRVFCPAVTAAAQGFADLGLEVCRWPGCDRAPRCRRAARPRLQGGRAGAPGGRGCRAPRWWSPGTTPCSARPVGAGPARLLQRLVARGADLTLGASSDLVAEARRLGARRARLAPVAAPPVPVAGPSAATATRAALGVGPDDIAGADRRAGWRRRRTWAWSLDVAAGVRDRADLRFVVVGEGPGAAGAGAADRRRRVCRSRCSAIATTLRLAAGRRRSRPAHLDLGGPGAGGPGGAAGRAAADQHPGRRHRGTGRRRGGAGRARRRGRRRPRRCAGWPTTRPSGPGCARPACGRPPTWPDEDDVVDDLLAAYAAVRIRPDEGGRRAGFGPDDPAAPAAPGAGGHRQPAGVVLRPGVRPGDHAARHRLRRRPDLARAGQA